MSDSRKLILTPFTGRKKKKKKYNIIKEKYVPIKRRQNSVRQTGDHITIKGIVCRIFRR